MANMNYELTYIINPELKPEEITSITKKVIRAIEKIGGEIIKNNKKTQDKNNAEKISEECFFQEPTKQKLAYPIKHFNFGYYTSANFILNLEENNASKNDLKFLDNELKLINNIIRHIIIKKEKIKNVPKKRKLKKEKDLSVEKAKIKEKNIKKEDKSEKSKKIKLENIDEKLDKILTDI